MTRKNVCSKIYRIKVYESAYIEVGKNLSSMLMLPRMLKKTLFVVAVLFLATPFVYKKREQIALWWALQSSPPGWAKEQIAGDLSPFREISQEALNETFQKISAQNIPAYRYRIIGGNIYRKPGNDHAGRAAVYDKMLKRIHKAKKIPSVDFILCVMDGVPEVYVSSRFWETENQAPLLCWAKKKGAPALVLVPDFLVTRESGWHRDLREVNEKYRAIPWEEREERAFWRGAASDKVYTLENYREKPRYRISELSRGHPDIVNAGFCRAPLEVSQILSELIVGNTPLSGHLSYKYLPVLDGWMCTFPGFQWRLLSGSLTLKQESDEVQYFYSALKPFVHYIPVKNNMDDLLEKITWAKGHDVECRAIAENARTFALQNLMPNQIYAYLYWVLNQYAALQSFSSLEIDSSWKKVQ